MSIRDAARIAALEARVIELAARLEQIERAHRAKVENDTRQRIATKTREGRR